MSVTVPRGFRASGVDAGIKGNALDLALIDARRPVAAAGVFTTSLTAAPPVIVSRRRLSTGRARAVVVNSGSANAGTGDEGIRDAERMAAEAARSLGCPPEEVLVCSTGPIGGRLPLDRISAAVPALVASLGSGPEDGERAARAIMTTDSIPKSASVHCPDGFAVGGIAKGAGMLRPGMATMLAFLTTDAVVADDVLARLLREAVATTFNCLNVDGCQSTNDTVLLLASGESGVEARPEVVQGAVEAVCADLALQMARDAEGATRVVRVRVTGAESREAARQVGMAVADSALVRSSFYGGDPNWGRVLAAVGVAGVAVDPGSIDIAYDSTVVCRGGAGVDVDEEGLAARLGGDFEVTVSLGAGPGEADIVTTDLTPDYVRFNGERS